VIESILATSAIAASLSLVGLLVAGARCRHTGVLVCSVYAMVIVAAAWLLGERLGAGPAGELATGSALAWASVLACARLKPDLNPAGQSFLGTLALTCVAFAAYAGAFTFSEPLSLPAQGAGVVLIALESFAFGLLIVGTHEVLDVVTRVRWRRRTEGAETSGSEPRPFVSVQVPMHNEPPELVLETLRALRALDYAAFEVVVLDNNTADRELWEPVAAACRELGFRFVHLEDWPGFKAGALNHGLSICDARTQLIAVVDADFVVQRDFLARTVGCFADPRVAIVQTAQGFRREIEAGYLRRLALTYKSFDEVTMPSRNERNAIIFAGTMGLIRRSALEEAGGWGEWCVTEDAELSLRILARGYTSLYLERELGHGVMPLTFAALKRQRFRWCLGGVQLLRRHWRLLLTGRAVAPDGAALRLTPGQRYDYLTAGLQWFQGLVMIMFTLLLLLGVASEALGLGLALRPLAGYFVAVPALLLGLGLLKGLWGLRARMHVGWWDAAGVFAIFLSLSWAVALACLQGLTGRRAAFLRTPKFTERQKLRQALRSAQVETGLALLSGGAVAISAALGHGLESAFLFVLCGWSALVYGSAPAAAYWATRSDLPTRALRHRRELESARRRMPLAPARAGFAYAGAGAALALLLMAPSLAIGPAGTGLAGLLRPGEERHATGGKPRDGTRTGRPALIAAPRKAGERAPPAPARPGSSGGTGSDGDRARGIARGRSRTRRPTSPNRRTGPPASDRGAAQEPTSGSAAPQPPTPGTRPASTPTPSPSPGTRPAPTPPPTPTPVGKPTATPTPPPTPSPHGHPTATPTPVGRPTATPTPRGP